MNLQKMTIARDLSSILPILLRRQDYNYCMIPVQSDTFAILATIFSIIGKFGIAGTFNIVFIHASELYPTPVRSIGVGIANAAGRFGGTLAPIVNAAAGNMSYLPMVIFGALGAFQDRILNIPCIIQILTLK